MLKPCPFCGHDKPTIERYGTPRVSTQYDCGMCGCRLETNEEQDHGLYWNYRPCEKALEARITKLETELARYQSAAQELREILIEKMTPEDLERLDSGINLYASALIMGLCKHWTETLPVNGEVHSVNIPNIGKVALEIRREHGKSIVETINTLEAALAEATENLDWLENNPRRIVHSNGYRGAADSWCWRDATAALATHEAPTLREAIKSAREGA